MAGFRKAQPKQAFLKVAIYGPQGSGKTFTTLLCAEGLAKLAGKRIAFVDTERGTDFYAQAVKGRAIHPEAFDFDALYSRSITEVRQAVEGLDLNEYGVIVLDSMTHLWEAAIASYRGRTTRAGTLPMHAWGAIKKPYKALLEWLVNQPVHVFILGRQGNVFEEDAESGEVKAVGFKMKAEGETPYEPHICLRLIPVRDGAGSVTYTAFAEKDRTGVLSGRTILNPGFDTLVKPILPYLGGEQAKVQTGDEAASLDADRMAADDAERVKKSADQTREFVARFDLCKTVEEVAALSKSITPEVKKGLTKDDLTVIRNAFLTADARTKGVQLPAAVAAPSASEE